MRASLISAAYVPGQSVLHQLHPTAKVVLLLVYVVVIAARSTPAALLQLELVLIAVTWMMRLPVRYKWLAMAVGVLLAAAVAGWPSSGFLRQLVVGIGRVVCLMLLVSLFGMATKANDLLPVGTGGWLHSGAFVMSLTVAMLPGIQYDLQRALDTETLRRGRRVGPLHLGVWLNLLPRLILRGLARADRLAEATLDRGFAPGRVLTPLHRTAFNLSDLAYTAVGVLVALLVMVQPS